MYIQNIDLVYFSPCGQGTQLAHYLSKQLPDFQTTLYDITLPYNRKPINFTGELIVFIFPTYAQDLPLLLKSFIQALPLQKKPLFLINLYGNIHPGKALTTAIRLFRLKRMLPIGAVCLVSSHSYNLLGLHIATNEPCHTSMGDVLQHLLMCMNKLKKAPDYTSCVIKVPAQSKNLGAYLPQPLLASMSISRPYLHKKLCGSCHKCLLICPTGHTTCIRCMACVKYCPYKALESHFLTPFPYYYLLLKGKVLNSNKYY